MTTKELALIAVEDAFLNWAYYDRQRDAVLSVKTLRDLIVSGQLTKREIMAAWEASLDDRFKTVATE